MVCRGRGTGWPAARALEGSRGCAPEDAKSALEFLYARTRASPRTAPPAQPVSVARWESPDRPGNAPVRPCRWGRRAHGSPQIAYQAPILLANVLRCSKTTISCVSFSGFFAFKEGRYDTQTSALLSSPTVSERFLRVLPTGYLQRRYCSGVQNFSDVPGKPICRRRFAAIRPGAMRGRGRDRPTRTSRGRPALWPLAPVVERYLPVSVRGRSCVRH